MSVPITALQEEAATGAASSDLRGIWELLPALRSAFDALRQQLADAHGTNARLSEQNARLLDLSTVDVQQQLAEARGTIFHLREQNARLLDLSTVDALQQQLADAHGTIAYLREKIEKHERLLDLVAPRRPWWRRWF